MDRTWVLHSAWVGGSDPDFDPVVTLGRSRNFLEPCLGVEAAVPVSQDREEEMTWCVCHTLSRHFPSAS